VSHPKRYLWVVCSVETFKIPCINFVADPAGVDRDPTVNPVDKGDLQIAVSSSSCSTNQLRDNMIILAAQAAISGASYYLSLSLLLKALETNIHTALFFASTYLNYMWNSNQYLCPKNPLKCAWNPHLLNPDFAVP
jgi:hypothetical protein